MTNTQLVIFLFGLLYVILIIYTRRRGDFEEFSVAGRSLGVFLIFSSLCASFIGPGMSLGFSREGFTSGFFLTIVAFLGCLGLMFMGIILAPKVRTKFTGSFSVGDIIGGPESHDHKLVRIAVGVVSVLFVTASVTATG